MDQHQSPAGVHRDYETELRQLPWGVTNLLPIIAVITAIILSYASLDGWVLEKALCYGDGNVGGPITCVTEEYP